MKYLGSKTIETDRLILKAQTMEEQIKGTREWAKIRAKKASSIEWEAESSAVRQLEI